MSIQILLQRERISISLETYLCKIHLLDIVEVVLSMGLLILDADMIVVFYLDLLLLLGKDLVVLVLAVD